jgi:ribosomal protein S18 acetylase RimI-like enzyme
MQALVSRSWAREKPVVNVHVGDLEWWTAQRWGNGEAVSLWCAGDELVGWACCSPKAELDAHLDRDHRAGPLFDLMLDWFESELEDRPAPAPEAVAFLFDPSPERAAAMVSRGYRRAEGSSVHHLRALTAPLPRPSLPAGFSIRHVEGPQDLDRRVAVHRSAFAPSRMTVERYRAAMAADHYRVDLDWVAVAPDGAFAAFCNIWLDEENRVALLEPVGTADGYRRMGLARSVCLAAMDAARKAGADTAIVLSNSENRASMGLYRSLAFEEFGRSLRFVKPSR